MQEKIFIAWSGTPEYAIKTGQQLSYLNFNTIIGGNVVGDSENLFVGETIISQMKQCSQAIVLIQKKENTNSISANLMFEFGYILNKITFNKIHVFFIDIEENDIKIPSDIRGIWADFVKTSDSNIIDTIVRKFNARQNIIISDDKINIILNSTHYKSLIESYTSEPHCTEFELAQYFIFFMQAVYFMEDYNSMTNILNDMSKSYHYYSAELQLAIRFCKITMEFYSVFYSKKDNILSKDMEESIEGQYDELLENCFEIKETEYKLWLVADIYEHRGFLIYYYLLFSDDLKEEKIRLYKLVIENNQNALKWLQKLNNKNGVKKNNVFFHTLLKAYIYRQRALSYKFISQYEDKISNIQKAKESFLKAFEMRKKIYNEFPEIEFNSRINDNMEMEYYLSISEVVYYNELTKYQKRYLSELKKYILSQKNKCDILAHHLSIIENNIKNKESL